MIIFDQKLFCFQIRPNDSLFSIVTVSLTDSNEFCICSQVKSGVAEKLSATAAKAKDVTKPIDDKLAKESTVKAVAPKKRGVIAKAAAATGKGRIAKQQLLRGKGLKKKKLQLRYTIDCTNIAEDSILDVADFVSLRINDER